MRNHIWFLLCLVTPVLPEGTSAQNVMISEFMSSNNEAVADEDGDYSDWIEIYNAGPGGVQLEGWGLSDNADNPYKWIFPKVTLDSGKYLLVWASGKNRRLGEGERTNGVMREVYRLITGSTVEALTQHASYPDKPTFRRMVRDFFEAPVNLDDNYGQRMQSFFKPPETGNYIFWLASDDKGQLWLSGDETTGNLRKIAEVPGWTFSREFSKYPQQQSAPVYLEKGKFYYLMALSKEGNGGDNLAVGWLGPDNISEIPASCRNFFWWAEQLHTNFNISADGEILVLTNSQGVKVDEMLPVPIPTDYSYGRKPENSKKTGFFTRPTPGQPNNTTGYDEILTPPEFSQPGGFYGTPFSLTLTSSKPGVSIVYTLDGSEPDIHNLTGTTYQYKNQYPAGTGSQTGGFLYRSFRSNLYTSPLEIKDRSGEANQVSSISTTYDANPYYFPSFPVDKAVIVKARAVKERALSSEVVCHTYFIKKGGINPYQLPVISFSAQEDELFNYSKGIYVAGTDFDLWRASNPNATADGGVPANYHRDGDFWEYPAHLELFETSGKRVLGQNIGFRIHGGWSRAHPFKSLRIYARSEYGEPELEYPFFPSRDGDSYKRIILRNSGNDAQYTLFRDAAMQEMVSHLNFETMAYQPAILFLNGEYWGVHNIRERIDKYYLASRFGINEDQLDILEDNSTVEEGDAQHYTETMDYIALNGVQNNENYEYVKKRIDISSFIDYMMAEIFIVNTDWPGNNIKFWRLRTPGYLPGEGPGKDGRWRWMMFDTDFGFGLYTATDYMKNMLAFTTATNGPDWPNPPWSTFLFRKLLENNSFRTDFIVRFCDQLNTAFKPAILIRIIDKIQSVLEPEMGRHTARWKVPGSVNSWKSNVNIMRNFAGQRPFHAWSHLRQFFGLTGEYVLTTDVSGEEQGYIVVNTIPIVKGTRGVPDPLYPWQGRYFTKIPLRLEAVAREGYEFVRWENGTGTFDQPVLRLQPDGDIRYTAVFRKTEKQEKLVHYWNFNNANDLLIPAYSQPGASVQTSILPGGIPEITGDTGESFTGENARLGDNAGSHLRINNPLGMLLTFNIPTTGFTGLIVKYETRRSAYGAGIQVVEYTTNGIDYIEILRITVKDDTPVLVSVNFGAVAAANDNPDFKIRIRFEQGDGGTAGNDRIDNFTLEGVPGGLVHIKPELTLFRETNPTGLTVFPNPFGSSAMVQLRFSKPENVNITLFDTEGRAVRILYRGMQKAGNFSCILEGNNLTPGIYILRCQTDQVSLSRKLIKF